MSKKFIHTLDVNVDANGNIIFAPDGSAISGNSRPDIITWDTGTNSYATGTGTITAIRKKALVYNTGAACLLSVGDESGEELPYIIPPYFVREIVFPFDVAASARVVIKNLTAGVNAGKVYVEFA